MPKLSWAFIAAAALLWGTVALSVWVHVDWQFLVLTGTAGAACFVLAGIAWMLGELLTEIASGILRDRVVRRLADALIASRRAARPAATTVPLQVVR